MPVESLQRGCGMVTLGPSTSVLQTASGGTVYLVRQSGVLWLRLRRKHSIVAAVRAPETIEMEDPPEHATASAASAATAEVASSAGPVPATAALGQLAASADLVSTTAVPPAGVGSDMVSIQAFTGSGPSSAPSAEASRKPAPVGVSDERRHARPATVLDGPNPKEKDERYLTHIPLRPW